MKKFFAAALLVFTYAAAEAETVATALFRMKPTSPRQLELFEQFMDEYYAARTADQPIKTDWNVDDPQRSGLVVFYLLALRAFDQEIPQTEFARKLQAFDKAWVNVLARATERREVLAVILAFNAFDWLKPSKFGSASQGNLEDKVEANIRKHRDKIWKDQGFQPSVEYWDMGISTEWASDTATRLLGIYGDQAEEKLKAKLEADWIWPAILPAAVRAKAIERFIAKRMSSDEKGFISQLQGFLPKMKSTEERALKQVYRDLQTNAPLWILSLPAELAENLRREEEALMAQLESLDHLRQLLETAFKTSVDKYYFNMPYGTAALTRILKAVEDGRIENPAAYRENSEPHAWLLYVVQNYLKHADLPTNPSLTDTDRASLLDVRVKVRKAEMKIQTPFPPDRCRDLIRKF